MSCGKFQKSLSAPSDKTTMSSRWGGNDCYVTHNVKLLLCILYRIQQPPAAATPSAQRTRAAGGEEESRVLHITESRVV